MPQPRREMSSAEARKSLPPPRIVRGEPGALEEGDNHLWAVSYSDLLMVLMSFFVIYFSFDDTPAGKNNMLSIVAGLKGQPVVSVPQDSTDPTRTKEGGPLAGIANGPGSGNFTRGSEQSFQEKLKSLGVRIDAPGKMLILHMEPNIFLPGQYQMTPEIEKRLSELTAVLLPHKDEIDIVVVGHTDSVSVHKSTNRYLSNNFDLSSLRALRALQVLLSQGFSEEQVSAQGAGENERNSRSLSLKIQLRGKSS